MSVTTMLSTSGSDAHALFRYGKPFVSAALIVTCGIQVEIKGGPDKETPLHIAARIKDGDRCADMLVKSGANVNATKDVRHRYFLYSFRIFRTFRYISALLAELLLACLR